jgi:hypothetical protein
LFVNRSEEKKMTGHFSRSARDARAQVRLDPADPSAAFLSRCFAEIFASLDERPRRLIVDVFIENERGASAAVDLIDGNPAFVVGPACVRADFRRRWLAEHPVPLVLRPRGATRLVFLPTDGNRVKVRRAPFVPFFRLPGR